MLQRFQGDRAALLGSVGIILFAMVGSGYLLGDGLRRAKMAERTVTVRGVSERDVTADLATWTISFSQQGKELAPVNQHVEQQSAAVRRFFQRAGFKSGEISDSGVSVSRQTIDRAYSDRPAETRVTVNRSIELRTNDEMKARAAHERMAELLREGVELESSRLNFSYTRLNEMKPVMIAEATKRARQSAEQFAQDSGASVGSIKSASQGYFSVGPRDGSGEEGGDGSGSPFQKLRVVTTVDYDIDAG